MTDSATSTDGATADSNDSHHERSRWPVVSAVGAGVLYAGVALFLLGLATDVFPESAGFAIAIVGIGAFVAGLVGWLNQAYLARYWRRQASDRKRRAYRATMVLFLVTDVATFSAGFTYYFFVRIGGWPPQNLPDVLTSLVLVNTGLLVLSSFTLHFSHAALENDRRNRFLALLGLTILLGVAFVAGQIFEYYEFAVGEGFTLTSGIFASAFYGLTGLHGLHVALGVLLLGIVFWRGRRGQYDSDRDTSITTVSYYWHFVDVVWIFLVLVLYVGAEITV
ncbi:heme-copper oxidase subunit III [Haladaptatus pallidirubidus]|uniref:Heme-copper oxidase subunit III n=1 Tax=Haladaptatus pallidirubidus TaxID=1008152 RepID=A0AAV3UB35_9EURY|nr:heme-copper oxidase subunit III [Haladaptatus pallidirubidus]